MQKFRLVFFYTLLLISSCRQKNELVIEDYQIMTRNFNFQNESVNLFKQNVITKKTNDFMLFVYNTQKKNDSLKILKNNKMYYMGVLLKKIDSKVLKINNSNFEIGKYYFESEKDYRTDCYLFINKEKGLIFIESLHSGTMTEFDILQFNSIQKAIALKRLGFKDGKFELQFAKMNYPILKEEDKIVRLNSIK